MLTQSKFELSSAAAACSVINVDKYVGSPWTTLLLSMRFLQGLATRSCALFSSHPPSRSFCLSGNSCRALAPGGVAAAADLPSGNLDVTVDLGDLAYSVYTSGSTGLPKGCLIGKTDRASEKKNTHTPRVQRSRSMRLESMEIISKI